MFTHQIDYQFHSDSFMSLHLSQSRCATGRYFQVIGNIHDIESYFGLDNAFSLNVQIFLCHWGHLAVIFMWVSANLFHIGCNANYELWIQNPIPTMPIAHGIWDPHFGKSIIEAYSSGGSDYAVVLSYSGIYNWLYTVGFTSVFQIYNFVIVCELLAVISILLGKLHLILNEELLQWLALNKELLFSNVRPPRFANVLIEGFNIRLNFHIGVLMGFFSIAWCGHLLHVAIPVSRGIEHGVCLTFNGGLKSDTASLYLTDIAHHHLAVGVLFVWAGHVYSSFYKAFGHRIRDVLYVALRSANSGGVSPMIRITLLGKSLHVKLALALAGCGVITSVVGQHIYSLTPYFYLSYDYVTTVALYLHHSWIAEFLMVAAFAHSAIFLIRDYTGNNNKRPIDAISRILAQRSTIISHLSWVCLWLGFHTLGVYIHNDTVVAFGEPEKQILIEPTNAQIIQQSSGKTLYGISIFNTVNSSSEVSVQSVNKSFGSLLLPLGPGDMLAHHAIALGLHVTVLILLKGALDGRGSKLMPDKVHQHYGYSCDGPGRGGTCDLSAWDSFYLATFWMLNTNAWVIFYFHWKHLTLWQNTASQFDESSTYLNAWFRDYLWFNSAPLIGGYNAFGANDLSVWAWIFLGAHLCWATGFMFLISWRGYWQELIDIILYMHLKTPILYDLWNGGVYTPVALSIVQARFVGLVHFAAGFILTYPPFIIGATS
jgi:photosystem I P700 chlorophyll a apoprotein A2